MVQALDGRTENEDDEFRVLLGLTYSKYARDTPNESYLLCGNIVRIARKYRSMSSVNFTLSLSAAGCGNTVASKSRCS
jgi:hypothetical protein